MGQSEAITIVQIGTKAEAELLGFAEKIVADSKVNKCGICGKPTLSKWRKPLQVCRGKRINHNGQTKYRYSECELRAHAGLFRAGGKYYIKNKAKRTELKKKPEVSRKKRKCLKCEQQFESLGPYRRICEPCGKTNERMGKTAKKMARNFQAMMGEHG